MPLHSFIDIPAGSDFPLENLPFGVFKPSDRAARIGTAIGEYVLDLSVLEEMGHFRSAEFRVDRIFARDCLNDFLAAGRPAWRKTREILQHLLAASTSTLRDDPGLRARAFYRQPEVKMELPARIGDYTDFYSSFHHAHNLGTM